jgi:proteasome lid subunit RPN8/RPN11
MLQIDRLTYDTLVAHARDEYPNEACALLAGPGDSGRVEKTFTLPNAEASPTFYVVDPKAQLRAMNEMDERGWDLVGIFHSHTFTEAYPSRTDVELAAYPDATYLILSLADQDAPVLRGFRIRDGQVDEVPVGGSGGLKSEAGTRQGGGHMEPSVSPPVGQEDGEAVGR